MSDSRESMPAPMQGLAEWLRFMASLVNDSALAAWANDVDAALAAAPMPTKLWLWKNFVDGKPEYWAFDNAYPINLDNGDPQTLGEPCGYAIFKPSRQGRTDVSEELVLRAIARASAAPMPPPVEAREPKSAAERLRDVMAQAAAAPGTAVQIPPDLAAEISAERAAKTRDEILAIRRREYMPTRDGFAATHPKEPTEARGEVIERDGFGPRTPLRWPPASATHPNEPLTALPSVDRLRRDGWSVAVHNDYRLNGESFTFWLMTKGNRCVKGEGRTDAEALEQIDAALRAEQPSAGDGRQAPVEAPAQQGGV